MSSKFKQQKRRKTAAIKKQNSEIATAESSREIELMQELNTRPFIVTDSFLFNAYYTASGATATICAPNKYNPETHLTQTLWVPQFSGNRTACLNLDHFVNNDGTGNNGNCMTEYRIYCVPWWFNERYLGILCARVAEAVGKPDNYPIERVLNYSRLPLIEIELQAMVNKYGKANLCNYNTLPYTAIFQD
jgi:hypothetical protein